MKTISTLIMAFLFASISIAAPEAGSTAEKDKTLVWTFTPDPALPNVLIIGDSISIGYTLQVRELLQGKANVFRPMGIRGNRRENCVGTIYGVENIDRWLAVQKWDVIHFNWGLHDLKHVKTAGLNEKSNDPNDPTQATLEEYTANMKILVAKLKATGAKLVFATTTPIAPGTLNPLRTPEAPVKYNAAALEIMKANGIRVNDLHALCEPHLKEWQKPRNCHFNSVGCNALAAQVAAVIKEELPALAGKVEAKAPNFLVLLGDDISSSSIGCYGSANPNTTPNIDKLAAEGIRFRNMFVANAVCGPTRAELYTGLQPYRNGCTSNHRPTKEGTLSIVQYLSELGYRVGLAGKTHISPKSVYPFEKVVGFPAGCTARAPKTGETWDGVEEFMTRNPEQPFCLFICSIHAHAPWDAGDTSHWELDELKLPPHMVDTQETRHFFREHLGEVRLFDEQAGKAQALLKKLKLDQNTAFIVLDENGTGMPGGKWTNYDWGTRSACIVKWPGISGFETDALAEYCDIVPTLIDAAGGEVPSNLDGKSLLPLITGKTKTHRDYAFFEYNSGREGPPFSSRAVTDGRFKLMWNLTPDNLFAVRTINGFDYGYEDTKRPDRHVRQIYKSWLEKAKTDPTAETLVQRYRKQPEFQLFDLDADPWEMNNLANNPEYATQLQKLKTAISGWMTQQGDDGKEPARKARKK